MKRLLLLEMLARTIKTQMKALLRLQMEKVRLSLEEPYKTVVAEYLNLLTQGMSLYVCVCVCVLRVMLRFQMEKVRLSLEEPDKTVVAEYLNFLTQDMCARICQKHTPKHVRCRFHPESCFVYACLYAQVLKWAFLPLFIYLFFYCAQNRRRVSIIGIKTSRFCSRANSPLVKEINYKKISKY